METKEYLTVDKSLWPQGEWHNEPDKIQWTDFETGLPCLIVRGPTGALCGYVGVPATHSLYGKSTDCCEVIVHGGLTFASICQHGIDESIGVCHVPGPGESDNVFWLGFDCAHAGDVCPAYLSLHGKGIHEWETYRSVTYVRDEVIKLAKQLAMIS